MSVYKPPFQITDTILNLLTDISEEVGRITVAKDNILTPRLRKENRIRTIHSSLAIEHNSLSLDQVTAIIAGKRVLGNPNEIKEVQNAYDAYELLLELHADKISDLLRAHKLMMQGLIKENGTFRSGDVGVFAGETLVHMAPPADMVPELMSKLFNWYKRSELPVLIKSCIFHYEFEFIHPFADGNGRMGRMWHTLLLAAWQDVFYWLPVEELVKERQKEYYNALARADALANSACFVEMMLQTILTALQSLVHISDQDSDQDGDQEEPVLRLIKVLGEKELSAVELMQILGLNHRPTFRKNYLKPAIDAGLVEMTLPDKPNSKKQKYKLVKSITHRTLS